MASGTAMALGDVVMGPGGYRFGDDRKLGLPMVLLFILFATFVKPIFARSEPLASAST